MVRRYIGTTAVRHDLSPLHLYIQPLTSTCCCCARFKVFFSSEVKVNGDRAFRKSSVALGESRVGERELTFVVVIIIIVPSF